MTQDEIIEMARQAGFEEQFTRPQDAIVRKGFDLSGEFKGYKANNAALEAFAKLVASISEGKWKQAVIDELVCCHIYNSRHEDDPRKAIKDAIAWNVDVALDPQVSSDAQALIDKEREACANMCDVAAEQCGETISNFGANELMEKSVATGAMYQAKKLSKSIRARGEA